MTDETDSTKEKEKLTIDDKIINCVLLEIIKANFNNYLTMPVPRSYICKAKFGRTNAICNYAMYENRPGQTRNKNKNLEYLTGGFA